MSVSVPRIELPQEGSSSLRSDYVAAMSRMTTSVTILATNGPAGRFGQTVSAVSSVCADPPVLLACLYQHTPVSDAVAVNGCFAVNVLGEDRRALADDFAGRTESRYQFGGEWRALRTGSPVLPDAPAVFDCEVSESTVVGTHVVVFGRVVAAVAPDDRDLPDLTYRARAYGPRHGKYQ
ncbi:flavin reductase family protein [Amycolatopsis cihanbeyliensis]|uniref:Flavin reductase n=1 Tax=Amycolatopsis cihanbeyliensis TaxID=1128664 RepID=A0A542DR79_AMYCI|nr:flavin reductase family protein [Amycolatopsis cihanbeyliensis]TQJ05587.1 flavin reductase [Amycolatopsis cihanbeyliensis]